MSLARCLFVTFAFAVGSAAHAEAGVYLPPALGTPTELTVSGRALKARPTQGSSVLSRNLRRLTASHWEDAPLEVRFGGVSARSRSGHDGQFEVTLRPPEGQRFPVGQGEVEVTLSGGGGGRARAIIVSPEAPFLVVSDFDDTVAVSHVRSTRALLNTALLQDSDTQPVVPGMAAFYRCLLADQPAVPGLAFVSGSPVQYTERLKAFLERHGFPAASLHLRDLGPSTLSGYKQPVLRRLFRQFPGKVVLVGDSGEQDPEVYAQLREEFPGRVARIYIRNAGRAEGLARFEDMMLFDEASKAAEDAAARGLVSKACVEAAKGASALRGEP